MTRLNIRLTQIDGKLPNLALMRLSHQFREWGHNVYFTRDVTKGLFEPPRYHHVFASCLFTFSEKRLLRFRKNFPGAIIGGTGSGSWTTVESLAPEFGDFPEVYDYSLYPDFKPSIGFLSRGCRLKCKFCVVPQKEGNPRPNSSVHGLWRGEGHPKKLLLLDNDFFGTPHWMQHLDDIRQGGFKVCFSQGINIRMITEETAKALASVEYRDDQFQRRRLYTAWDNLGDERVFFRGVKLLEEAGIPAKHLMVYMLIGYKKAETWKEIQYRFDRLVQHGCLPYPMVYDNSRTDLKRYQRWAVRGLYRFTDFGDYWPNLHELA